MAFWLTQYLKSRSPNFGQVSPTVYRSADPDERLGDWIARYKLEAILDLRYEPDRAEEAAVTNAGLIYTPIRMKDDEAPTPKMIRDALEVMRSGLVTLVHCAGGRHRTGLVVACYRVVVDSWSKERAWKEAEAIPGGWYDTFGHKPIRLWFEDQFKPEDYR